MRALSYTNPRDEGNAIERAYRLNHISAIDYGAACVYRRSIGDADLCNRVRSFIQTKIGVERERRLFHAATSYQKVFASTDQSARLATAIKALAQHAERLTQIAEGR